MYILYLIPLILVFICASKETKVTSLYKAFGVYGRISAYITASLLLGSIVGFLQTISSVISNLGEIGFGKILGSLAVYLLLFGLGILMYMRIAAKCPDGLRKKLLISIFITAFGVSAKICLFFIGSVWKIIEPQTVTGPNGESLIIFDGEVYDRNFNHVGSKSGHKKFTPNQNYYNR